MVQADGVRDAALVVFGRHDPDFAGEAGGDPFEDGKPRRVDAVVVGQENAIEQFGLPSG